MPKKPVIGDEVDEYQDTVEVQQPPESPEPDLDQEAAYAAHTPENPVSHLIQILHRRKVISFDDVQALHGIDTSTPADVPEPPTE